uniref:NADH-ubiquinone oxidoreductase chain 4L n=1 Tax=Erotylidae sp. BMNH 1274780 TaxID=1796505 RepID=A0A126TEU7_9CUCU|nr:NADH dehydrogenase subunit 4L [Erotylidae sp. BMNH 1274780]
MKLLKLMVTLFSIFSFLSSLFLFCMKRKHLLLMLLSLEFIIISLYMNMFIYLGFNGYDYYFCLIFLTMSVCEGVLGLSILISMIRSHGNDFFQTFNILW